MFSNGESGEPCAPSSSVNEPEIEFDVLAINVRE